MVPTLTRRQFVLLGMLVLVGVVCTLGLSLAWARSDAGLVRLVKTSLRKKLSYLDHDADQLSKFAEAYVAFMPEVTKRQTALLVLLLPVYALSDLLAATPARGRLQLFENTVVMKYLMSTDYFYRAESADGPLRFIGLYWPPYSMPCGNPFADLS